MGDAIVADPIASGFQKLPERLYELHKLDTASQWGHGWLAQATELPGDLGEPQYLQM